MSREKIHTQIKMNGDSILNFPHHITYEKCAQNGESRKRMCHNNSSSCNHIEWHTHNFVFLLYAKRSLTKWIKELCAVSSEWCFRHLFLHHHQPMTCIAKHRKAAAYTILFITIEKTVHESSLLQWCKRIIGSGGAAGFSVF